MSPAYKLDAHGGSLVTDGHGNLVAIYTDANRAQVTVKTSNPACASTGPGGVEASGWYTAWKTAIGSGAMLDGGVAHSAGEGAENTSETYTGTVTPTSPAVEVRLQLRAWHGDEYSPDGVKLYPFNISFSVTIDGQSVSHNFNGTSPSSSSGSWVADAAYWRVLGTFDFETGQWALTSEIVSP